MLQDETMKGILVGFLRCRKFWKQPCRKMLNEPSSQKKVVGYGSNLTLVLNSCQDFGIL